MVSGKSGTSNALRSRYHRRVDHKALSGKGNLQEIGKDTDLCSCLRGFGRVCAVARLK